VYVVKYEERSGGVKVNSPFPALYVRVDDPTAVKVTLGNGGTEGLSVIHKVIDRSLKLLKKNGILLLEIGFDQKKKS